MFTAYTYYGGKGNAGIYLDWTKMLSKEAGGPGESPGRDEAIESAKQKTAERYAIRGFKKAKGSKKAKPKLTVSRAQIRKAGW